jgi:hypothetical protein
VTYKEAHSKAPKHVGSFNKLIRHSLYIPKIALDSCNIMGHKNFSEPSLIFIMRSNVGDIYF